ncbi:MAG: Diguanylate cyclase/phosphodiesterase [Frankiales bacterium]|nr:Diguanylate cyclase/phosphodiesterase [Frankiales bacterium]
MTTPRRRIPVPALAVAAVGLALSAVVVVGGDSHSSFVRSFNDLAQLAAAAAAALTAGHAALRSSGRARWMWLAVAVGCAGWAAGESVWSWYELARGIDTPFPSLADIGFLLFPAAAGVALLLHPARGGRLTRSRRALDATLATSALALVSWETALGAVVSAGGDSRFALGVALAYPLSDFLLLVLIVLTFSRASGSRAQLALLAAGMAALSVSDSGFAYLTSNGTYDGGAIDLGWITGFVLIALAPLVRTPEEEASQTGKQPEAVTVLPYLSVAVAGAVTAARMLTGHPPTRGQTALSGAVVLLILVRQYLTLRENAALVGELAVREAQLRHQAFHDALTGLANRGLFQDRLGHALDLHGRDLRAVSVLFLDLDDFKVINDTLGHAAGDELLVRISERLLAAVRTGDTVARLGGDEFAILLEDGGDPLTVAASVELALRPAFVLDGSAVKVGASIGLVAVEPSDTATTADALLAKADTAMYTAKRSGKGQLRVFEEGMSLTELSDQRMGTALAHAVETGGLTLDYQPVVNLDTGQVEGLEALARWTHDGRVVPPSEFIPVAERTGVIGALTEWALDEACRRVAGWSRGHKQLLQISVNVSPPQITDPGFVATVTAVLARHRLRRGQLVLEITESSLLTDVVLARGVIAELRDAGVRIALDDFGVGFSSLSQLHAIELDIVKIDRSFIDQLDTDPRQVRFLRSLLRLGGDLGLQVVGEGVERQAQLDLLRELGCRLVQGYLLARPMPPDEVPAAIAGQSFAALS